VDPSPDPHNFGKINPDPHQSWKLDQDPHPHQSEKVEALVILKHWRVQIWKSERKDPDLHQIEGRIWIRIRISIRVNGRIGIQILPFTLHPHPSEKQDPDPHLSYAELQHWFEKLYSISMVLWCLPEWRKPVETVWSVDWAMSPGSLPLPSSCYVNIKCEKILKGRSHEIDFKTFDKNLQNLA
jgi:hypothetical protein